MFVKLHYLFRGAVFRVVFFCQVLTLIRLTGFKYILVLGPSEEELLTCGQVETMLGERVKDESKKYHDDLCDTAQISQKVEGIINFSGELILLIMQPDAALVEEHAIIHISDGWSIDELANTEVLTVLGQLSQVSVFVFGVDNIQLQKEVVVGNVGTVENICCEDVHHSKNWLYRLATINFEIHFLIYYPCIDLNVLIVCFNILW